MPLSTVIAEMPTSDEAPHLAQQAARLILCELENYSSPDEDDIKAQVTLMAGRTTVAAFSDQLVVAVGSMEMAPRNVADIEDMVVAPGQRGTGLGKKIIAALEGKAKTTGVKELHVLSAAGTREFYERLGYQRNGTGYTLTKSL